jgi:hypothetical protein
MKQLILAAAIAALTGSAFAGTIAEDAAKLAKEKTSVNVQFGKGEMSGIKFAFAKNAGKQPLTIKHEIFKVGAFKPAITGDLTLNIKGKEYVLIETDPEGLFLPGNTMFPVPKEKGEYAVRMTASNANLVKKGVSVSRISTVREIVVLEGV